MKIEDLLYRAQVAAQQEALDRGEPPPEPEPITFNTMQELLQKGELSAAEAALLDYLLAWVEQPRAELGDEDAGLITNEAMALLKAEARRRRVRQGEGAVPDRDLRSYAPGPPTPGKVEGPRLPLHGALMGADLPEDND